MIIINESSNIKYKKFIDENRYGVDKMISTIQSAITRINKFNTSTYPNGDDFDVNSFIKPSTIDMIQKFNSDRTMLHSLPISISYEKDIDSAFDNVFRSMFVSIWRGDNPHILNIFGNPKFGERSKNTLNEDVKYEMMSSNEASFDLSSSINVGFNLDHMFRNGLMLTDSASFLSNICNSLIIDVSTTLIRYLQSKGFNDETDSLITTEIISTIMDKVCRLAINMPFFVKELCKTSSMIKAKTGSTRTKLKIITMYKFYHNLSNDIDLDKTEFLGKSMDMIDGMYNAYLLTGGLRTSTMLRDSLVNNHLVFKRYVDIQINRLLNESTKDTYNIQPKTLLHGSVDKHDGVVKNTFDEYYKGSFESIDNVPFMESVNPESYDILPDDLEYKSFIKGTRMEVLAKLTHKERNTFSRYEADISRLNAQMRNCRKPDEQAMIINRSDKISKLMSIDMEKFERNPMMAKLLLMLDTHRSIMTDEFSGIDFERHTFNRLYGPYGNSFKL